MTKEDSVVTIRLSEDLLTLLGRYVSEGGRSAYIRDAIRSHAALLDLLGALGCQRNPKQ